MKKHGYTSLTLLTLTSCFTLSSHAALVINEIDYDQPGTDNAEFIELYNTSATTLSLNNYSIELINGNNSSRYRSIDLSGFDIAASGYLVVCSNAATVTNCDFSFTSSNGWFQNGAPDAIGLLENGTLIDSLSYEGVLQPYTKGNVFSQSDSNSVITSIGRKLDGVDTNDNASDFELGCITPGTANVGGSGDCSAPDVSAVPLPATAWLLASGVLGLAGFSRRK